MVTVFGGGGIWCRFFLFSLVGDHYWQKQLWCSTTPGHYDLWRAHLRQGEPLYNHRCVSTLLLIPSVFHVWSTGACVGWRLTYCYVIAVLGVPDGKTEGNWQLDLNICELKHQNAAMDTYGLLLKSRMINILPIDSSPRCWTLLENSSHVSCFLINPACSTL